MSLNNIELGDLIVSELYRDSLLATEARPGTGPLAKATPSSAPPKSTPDSPSVPGQGPGGSTKPAIDPSAAAPSQSVPRPPAGNTPAPGSPIAPSPGAGAPAGPITRTSDPIPPAPGYKFLGNNRRKITILVQSPGVAFLPDDQLAFLTKMLEACRMNMGDVAIVNHATAPVNITVLKQQLHPAILLLFGMEPVAIKLPMNFPVFKIQTYDACTYLSAPSLEDLVRPGDENKLLKSKLWMCLKTIFEI